MWVRLSRIILRNRIFLLIMLGIITVFMAFQASKVEMSYEYAQLLPKKDSANVDYQNFRKLFGEEGNLIVVGIEDAEFFKLPHFNQWVQLNKDLREIDGVENLLSASSAFNLKKNAPERKFELEPVFPEEIATQEQLDSLAKTLHSLPFYKGLLYNPADHAYMLAITVNKDKMQSKEREKLVLAIKERCDTFSEETGLEVHYSGLPYIRVINSIRIKKEIYLFSALAMGLCIITLFLFFRSFKAVLIPMLIVLTGVVWALGTMSLFGFKITLLTGMIPSLLIVIGIPNSIYMLNKYHHEFRSHGNKIKSLQRVIIKIGNATFLTNLTTASGFATFVITNSEILRQFGVVASLNIMTLFLLSILMIPTIFSFFIPPKERHIQHLENRNVKRIIDKLVDITYHHIKWVYASAFVVLLLGFYGITQIKSSGFMVDDIPESDVIYQDLKFFENHVDGIMPLEIIVDTKKPNGAMNLSTFNLIEKLEQHLATYDELSSSVSLLNILKFSKQAFYNGKERYYSLPSNQEKNFILAYANNSTQAEDNGIGALHSFLDSTQQITRVSIRMKDVGTKRMAELYNDFRQEVDSIFPTEKYKVTVTGSSITFFKGTQYLVKNLFSSLALAVLLISAFMAIMFYSWRMVLMSLIPNILPLIFTAAIMGFTGIPIKASTILVFSIAFGISVDNTIHFLAKYRQELNVTGWDIRRSVKLALRETGVSMLYTFVVLFFGFGVYSVSQFGGTAALGVLVSLTLLVAILSNLILLPSLLIGLERLTTTRSFREPLLAIYNEEEDIELDDLEIQELPLNKEKE
ncbi:efflux RND transporter permease subunit [Gaoshiqia sediminis]|uniref:MMPL family transporter n=1 Tax=Gaoshiqia sediminis TaxID=2986998 RepID=A0AA41Y781_9BACT|nr:MMPL family transporter [Gaoshiqia sediminis]MCW0483234.1 MMPL family transporter [Gaoshiqia sediminis]